jgi:arginase
MSDPAVVALLCRTSDRTDGGARAARAVAEAIADRCDVTARMIGSPGEGRDSSYQDDLRDSKGCLMEAGGQVDDAFEDGRFPILVSANCSICMTTLPVVASRVEDVRILWIDAHGDFNTPRTTPSGFLGGMCLSAACGRWDAGFGHTIDPTQVIVAGARDLDPGEAEELSAAGVLVVDGVGAVADAVDGHAVFVHLDLDVVDPTELPASFPAPGGPSTSAVRTLLEEVVAAADSIVGLEITPFDATDDEEELERMADRCAWVAEPLLPE